MFRWILIFFASFSLPVIAESDISSDWELERDRDGIQIWTRAVADSKHKEVRSEMILEVNLKAAVGLVRDTTACSEWAALCKEAIEHEIVSEVELYIYTYNDVPWPVKDRDALSHVVWSQDPTDLSVTMIATATTGRMPANSKAVRITQADTRWKFVPLADGRLKVISQAHVNPAGPPPAWLTNLLLVDVPFDTLNQMRDVLLTGRYDDAHFEFIRSAPE